MGRERTGTIDQVGGKHRVRLTLPSGERRPLGTFDTWEDADAARRAALEALEGLPTVAIPVATRPRWVKLTGIRPWPDSAGVYIIRFPGTRRAKIGVATNIRKRLSEQLCGYPVSYDLLAVVDGDRKTERALHRRFWHLRCRGKCGREWFQLREELLDYVRELRRSPTPGGD